ncbi:probable beta-1,3-galactosyltransferase 14 isoform X2 [Amborella trichopoda]|uniref:probable beta-1,3-galactosyltransferase 14 isoform X2 n=1 Tax=Amborella trichopoda TaxID=13333 RepID=UPI0009C14A0B|nr:probable beta-1,3-galactosyltransferase 14 isoform X2 [Amborella trichopoda]|eukprot:XP_020527868.1 probable beta-1,3-galactosyltransferase 14 isoform X2 [Amborella trichopoda]
MPSAPTFNRKVLYTRNSWLSIIRRPSFSLFCLIIGFTGIIFGLIALSRPISTYKCNNFRVKSLSVNWVGHDVNEVSRVAGSENAVNSNRHNVMGFVGIQTGFGSVERRKALRRTWMPSDPDSLRRLEEATGLAFRFVIGRTNDPKKMSDLRKEIEEYDDFLLLDVEEEYSKLPYKTLAFFKAAYRLFDSDFYVKADDDIYLRPDRLTLLLAKERTNPRTYLGCMKKGPVFTDPKLKCFRMFSNEDVTIGSWMLAMNVNHEDNHELCSTECTSSSIAVWDIPNCSGLCRPEEKMLTLHNMKSCTETPTLASEE